MIKLTPPRSLLIEFPLRILYFTPNFTDMLFDTPLLLRRPKVVLFCAQTEKSRLFFFPAPPRYGARRSNNFFDPPQKNFGPHFFFGPTNVFQPFATNHAARHMGSGPRPSTHRDSELPLDDTTCYFDPRARFVNIYLRVCLTSHYLLTTYLRGPVR